MATDRARLERAVKLFFERWLEQIRTSFPSRRARTLGACAALDEVLGLAESWVRSGGVTRPAVDPLEGGHGVVMLPDVAEEALHAMRSDEVLKRRHPCRKAVLEDILGKLRSKENVSQDLVEELRALLTTLRHRYVQDAFDELERIVTTEPHHHSHIVSLADSLVSELRAGGWTDEGLDDATTDVRREAQADRATPASRRCLLHDAGGAVATLLDGRG